METGQMIEWEHLDKAKFLTLGPLLAVGVRGAVYPFSLIKTRLFMQDKRSIYNGTWDAFKKILRYEGVKGLYKGFGVSLYGILSGQMYIVTYELTRSHLHGYRTEVKGLIAGGVATLVAQTVTVPIDIISQHRMMAGQVQQWKKGCEDIPKPRLPSAYNIAKKIARTEGPRGFFKGYTLSLLTYAPNSALWWSFYSGGFQKAAEMGLLETLPLPLVQVFVGICSATVAATITNPADIIRTRYQVSACTCINVSGQAATIHTQHYLVSHHYHYEVQQHCVPKGKQSCNFIGICPKAIPS